MVVLSLVNGMIGGLILILPVLALQGGYLSTFFVIGITGLFSYYSAKLCVLHIGNSSDLDMAIYKHFDNSKKMKVFYDLCVWANILLFCMLYFELITIQWIGLAAPHRFTQTNAVLNAILLFVIVIAMKFYDFGANLMAYGVISIASYLVFLGWVVMSQESTGIPAEYKAVGSGAV
jgi:amino acid permease